MARVYVVSLLLLLSMAACQRRPPYVAQIRTNIEQGQEEIAKLKETLASATTAEDSLLLLTQAIACYADAGMDGHVNNNIWQQYSLGRKLHLCATDSVRLLCGSASSLFLDAIDVLTPWQAFAYNHGASIKGVTHVTVLVNMNGKLIHADPLFGYVMYDASADTLLDFFNELKYLKEGEDGKLKRKQLPFSNDFLICMDSTATAELAGGIYSAIGLQNANGPQVQRSLGICPYKMKAQMTVPRWLKLEQGGGPYIKWLTEKGHPSIEYLVLYPLGVWSSFTVRDTTFMHQYYKRIQDEIEGGP